LPASDEPVRERRPLSTFSAPEQPATTVFHPVFEVDAFRWPRITDELLNAHHPLLIPVIEQLLEVSAAGRSLVGLAGTRSDVGCATLLMSLARLLTNAGKSVALVDANFGKATLGRSLGLDFEAGWEDVLTGELPLAECVVKSLQDNTVLLPLTHPTSSAHELLASIQTSVTAGVLRYHYDLVLFNLGAAAQPPQHEAAASIMQHCRLDAGIIVADTTATVDDPMDTLLSLFGSACLGVVGNSAL
jgi:Mrp family chromosome partitioning ATPase